MLTERWSQCTTVFLRLALGTTFLAAVTDRFGLWGALGQPNVSWGDFAHFLSYAAQVNALLPHALMPLVAWLATVLETLLGLTLTVGLQPRISALGSAVLLPVFALAVSISIGVKSALNDSVFSASAGAFLLATSLTYPWTLDAFLKQARQAARDRADRVRLEVDRADRDAQQNLPGRKSGHKPGV